MRRSLDMIGDAAGGRASAAGPRYWRSLEELADTPAFRDYVAREFPEQAASWTDPVTRRQFLTLMGASLALAGAAGCNMRQEGETWVPYVRKPEEITPGKALYFATAMPLAGSAVGLLVESREGRPIKIEGNPQHPASRGATDAYSQASILTLYDPDRSKALRYLDRIRGWNEALSALQQVMAEKGGLRETRGRHFRILSETITSPSLAAQRDALLRAFPEAKWYQYEPAVSGAGHAGTRLAFGDPLDVQYRFAEAKVVLTLDADPFGAGPAHLTHARDFMDRRRKLTPAEMNRHYAVESAPTASGMRADHRLPLRAGQVETFARALAAKLGYIEGRVETPDLVTRWVDAVAADLKGNGGRSVVVPGEYQPAAVHALAHAINSRLGNVGKTVVFTQPVSVNPSDPIESLRTLCDEMDRGDVRLVLILGGNPVYTAPADLNFKDKLLKVPQRVRLGLYDDETSRWCQWHIPETHFLETWGDTRTFDGTCTVMQPLIAPLYGGRSALEVLAAFSADPLRGYPATRTGHEMVRDHWRQYHTDRRVEESFDRWWRRCVHDGVVAGTAFPTRDVTLGDNWRDEVVRREPEPFAGPGQGYELVLRPDPTVFDGRFANNGWLQELPKPLTKLTWDNAALVSQATAEALGLTNTPGWHGGPRGEMIADTVNLAYSADGRDYRLEDVPALILPGHPDGVVTLHLGYGRTVAGQVGSGAGVNAYVLQSSRSPYAARGVSVTAAGRKKVLASTQNLFLVQSQEAYIRGVVRTGTLAEYQHDPQFPSNHFHQNGPLPPVGGFDRPQKEPAVGDKPLDLYPGFRYDGYKWGMVIDLNACVGCGGCVVACQSENNVPVVGKTEVTRGRIMHWLRIDEYFRGDPAHPESVSATFQPLMCVHCENAPCEVVCPVEATSHSTDGLNEMTYNRCVGTRYCSNNCPYKVRRFNFLKYSDYTTESLKSMRNPDVTVRSRGVMEKCTFCVQRIRTAQIEAKNRDRYDVDPNRPGLAYVGDGEVVVACQAACPTGAIVFGDMNDLVSHGGRGSDVARLKGDPRHYGLLSDLNTRPRLTFLAAVRNPNPALEPPEGGDHA
ncbi:MAG TPA: TAT-variant-translocated molybdopterin oxidoreductase [Gemmataceae bacterium]|jgi:molybdopterin-containing oxidoreductase family iron-sulfur binding subunit